MNAWVTLTNRCNSRCLFCYELDADGERATSWEVSEGDLSAQIGDAVARAATGVVLTGGEPTLSPLLGRAMVAARAAGLCEVVLATNGRRLAYAPYADHLVGAGLTHAHVSLHSHRADVHDALSCAPEAFSQTVTGVRNLIERGVEVTTTLVVNLRNFKDLAPYFDFVHDLGVRRVSVMGLKPFGGAFQHHQQLQFDAAHAAEFVNPALAYGIARGLAMKTMGLSREHFDVRGTDSDDARAFRYFEQVMDSAPEPPPCVSFCGDCFGRPVCRHQTSDLPLGRLVCKCGYVYEETIRAAVRQGARRVGEVGKRTGAGQQCGGCVPRIRGLVKERGESVEPMGPLPRPPVPAGPGAFARVINVAPHCRGEEDTPGCVFSRGNTIYPELACHQRCLFGEAAPGSDAWQETLFALPARIDAPVYVYGADGAMATELRHALDTDSRFRGDLCGAVLCAPESGDVASLVPQSARRDARIGQKKGLEFRVETDEAAVSALYALYCAQCERLGAKPLPRSFIDSERAQNPDAFGIALVRTAAGKVCAGRLILLQQNYVRLVDGGWLREHADLMPEAFLHVSLIEWGLLRKIRVFDAGIAESQNVGWRHFKRRLGFREIGAVCAVQPAAASPSLVERIPVASAGRIDIALGERCNHDCHFCYRDVGTKELTTLEAKTKIAGAAKARYSGVALSGGEPTLRKDLAELIRFARQSGISDVQLHTNGTVIDSPARLQKLVDAGLCSAMVSFHSHRPDVYRKITGHSHLEEARASIKNLLAANVHTLISHVVCAHNYRDLPEFSDYVAREFGGAEIFFFYVYPGDKTNEHPEIVPRLPEVEPYWYRALARLEKLGVRYTVDCLAGFPPCYMRGFEHAAKILWMKSLQEEIGEEADDHIIKRSEMRKPAICERCAYADSCLGFWASYLDRFGDGDLKPVLHVDAVASRGAPAGV